MTDNNPQAPHRAVIFIQAEIHELLPTGECSGRPVAKVKSFPIYFDGLTCEEAEKKLNAFISEVKVKCLPK